MKGIETDSRSGFGRRTWMKAAAALAGGAAAAGVGCSKTENAVAEGARPSETHITVSDSNAIVDTTAGKVQGFTRNGIQTFRGIPYAASTAAGARFLAPSKPEPWKEARTALWYGKTCPQEARMGWESDVASFLSQWDDGQPGEDCLRVNVWTPGLDNKKRPVMFWIHGGGFSAGSGQEQPAYYGENLARRGDVVVVSVNHRLGVLGYLNLASFGSQYAESANAGMWDLVAALGWVRDNIANFGGDPGNVLIFGQSGGGCKVTTLMTMPAAKGLFHKAVVQSGSLSLAMKPEMSAKLGEAVVAQLGLSKAQIAKIHEAPVASLIAAGQAAMAKLSPPAAPGGPFRLPAVMWGPTIDGKTLPAVPFDPAAPEISAGIPMLIGSTLHEMNPAMGDPKAEGMTDAQLKDQLTKAYGDKAASLIETAKKLYPNQKPVAIAAIIGASMFRLGVVAQCERKVAQNAAPVYMYQFAWETPVMDGRPRAFHCSEIPFVFYNTDVSAFCTGGGAGPRALAAKVSDAWINFARKGDPNHPDLPQWPKYSKETGSMMVFNTTPEVKNDYDKDLRAILERT
jgi:para-nitrobenzyl esterase